MTVFTIGHSTRTLDAFLGMLRAAGVDSVADVRRFPRSRRHPHFNAENLAPALAHAGIAYHHFVDLGGRRGNRADGRASPHTLWREAPFRNFADYAETPPFRAALDAVIAMSESGRLALLCAEAVWWRCHRRIIADYLIAQGIAVEHIFDEHKRAAATMTPGARLRADGTILYDGAQPRLL